MTESESIILLLRELMFLCVKLIGPPLIISMVVGLIVAIFQAATQIHEQTLTFVPKLVVIGISLLLMGSWIFINMQDFTLKIFDLMASV